MKLLLLMIATLYLVTGQQHTLPAGTYRLKNAEVHAVYLNTVTPAYVLALQPGTDTLLLNDMGKLPIVVTE